MMDYKPDLCRLSLYLLQYYYAPALVCIFTMIQMLTNIYLSIHITQFFTLLSLYRVSTQLPYFTLFYTTTGVAAHMFDFKLACSPTELKRVVNITTAPNKMPMHFALRSAHHSELSNYSYQGPPVFIDY